MENIALVVGASGITGGNLAEKLVQLGWTTYGLARNPGKTNYIPVQADLLDIESLQNGLKNINPTHVFITTWMRHDTEAENIRVNSLMIRNLLNVLANRKTIKHVALVTGLKHYLGPFDAYAKEGLLPETPLREEHPRLPIDNFYYAQEDEVFAGAKRDGYSWSIHRPHTVIGKAVGNAMNMGTTLAVYAAICKETNRPFQWPGSEAQWNGISDVTDARLLAEHLIWAATSPQAKNQAFNVVNGDIFRWSRLWHKIADYFDIERVGYEDAIHPLEKEMANDQITWTKIAEKYQLEEHHLDRLASAWHTDLDLGRPIEVMTDMSKSRKLGFLTYQNTEETFFGLFDELKKSRLIPSAQ